MPKVKSQVKVMTRKFELNKRDILAMTFTSEECYATLQFNTAIAWIRAKIWPDEDLVNSIIQQKSFWKWWLNQWNLRDDRFLTDHIEYTLYEGCSEFLNQEELKKEWILTHNVQNIDVMPDSEVMAQAYNEFLVKAIKEQAK